MIGMQRIRMICTGVAGLSICVILSACINKNVPTVTYYSLLSIEQMGEASPAISGSNLRIGIGPVTIPDVLKRSQIVSRTPDNIYQFDEYHRWAGILEKDISYVLGDNLEDLTGAAQVAFFPWMPLFKPTHRITVDVIRFDGDLSGEAVLSVRWTLTDGEDKTILAGGRNNYRRAIEGDDYFGLIKAESYLLADFSRDLAEALQTVEAQN